MRDRARSRRFPILALAILLALPAVAQAQGFTDDFFLEFCTFSTHDGVPFEGNPFFRLRPGWQLRYEGEDDGEELDLQITVLSETELIDFTTPRGHRMTVRTRVVEEREEVDGELVEVSRNFFARCRERNDIFYFGETVDIYEDGEVVSHDGAWRAGEDGAQPGILMPGTFLLGAKYFQEIAPDVALDRGENTAMGLTVEVPAGTFHRCVEVIETSPLEPGHESRKVYCPKIGLVIDDDAELVEVGFRR